MLTQHDLKQFTGTSGYTRFSPLFPRVVLTDGALHVAEHAGQNGGFWIMDVIASHQPALQRHPDARLRDMQFWKLKVNADKSAVITCVADTGEPPAVEQQIPFTDFDLPEIDLWVAPLDHLHYAIYLPSEH